MSDSSTSSVRISHHKLSGHEFALRIYEIDTTAHCLGYLLVASAEVTELLKHVSVLKGASRHYDLHEALVRFQPRREVLTREGGAVAWLPLNGTIKGLRDLADALVDSILYLRGCKTDRERRGQLALDAHRAYVAKLCDPQSALPQDKQHPVVSVSQVTSTTVTAENAVDVLVIPPLLRSLHFAILAHDGQRRKGKDSTPYITHPVDVTMRLSAAGVTDVDVLMSGLLHDVLEDTSKTAAELESVAGSRTLSIVKECSDDKSQDKVTRKKLQIDHAATASVEARQVKLADKLSNLADLLCNPPATWSADVITGYQWWSLAVARACGESACPPLYRELVQLLDARDIHFTTQEALDIELAKYYAILDNPAVL